MVLELQTPSERRICQQVILCFYIPTNPFIGLVTNIAVYVFDSILCVYQLLTADRRSENCIQNFKLFNVAVCKKLVISMNLD